MKMRRSFFWIAAAPALLLVGCQPDIPEDPEPGERVIAVFDPDTSTIPLPNTAAIEDDGTLPKLDGAGEDSAEGAFLAWLDDLHGWSEATPITVPFSGELDPDTVTDETVLFWRRDGESFTELEAEPVYEPNGDGTLCDPSVCASIIRIVPAEPLEAGASYAAVVTKGVEGANGEAVSESAAIFFAASPEPLFEDGEATVSVLSDDPAQAATLEGLRQLLAPVFAAAADANVDRNDVATAFTWTIAKDPFTVLDPATATLPIPNDVALEADGTFPAAALNFCGGPGVDPEVLADDSCDAPSPDWASCETSADCDDLREEGDPFAQCVSGRCVYPRCAQGQFDTYLDQLHGWPTTTPITLPVTQEIDPATLNDDNVQLWVLDDDGNATKVEGTTVTLSECGDEIVISLPAEMPAMGYATKYIAFATRDVTGLPDEEGNALSLIPPAPVLLAIMPHDPGELGADCAAEEVGQVCDGGGVCGAIPGEGTKCVTSTIGNVSDADAASVMAIRPLFRPAVETVEAATDLDWDDLASIWTWTTWTDTFMVFDPTSGNIPFPHTLLTNGCPDGEPICNLPDGEGATAPILAELKTREGFSTTAPHWIPTIGPPLDPDSVVKGEGVLFAEANEIPPPLFPGDEWTVSYEYEHIIARFERPLTPDILVAGLTTTDLIGANGFPAQPTPAFVFLRSEFPLIDEDGNSEIAQIPNDEIAAVLEASRQEFEQLFLVALLFGYGRDQVNNAWAFVTGHTTRPLQQLRALTLDQFGDDAPQANAADTPDVTTDPTVPSPYDMTVDVDVANVEEIHWNVEYETYWWLDENNRLTDSPTRATVGASVFIPVDPNGNQPGGCEAPYDVAIVQHGLGNFRRGFSLAFADELAANCIATVAIDLPLHGGRIPGSPELHPLTLPDGSGDGFISEDFVSTVALLQQATIDEVVLANLIKSGAFDAAVGTTLSDSDSQIGYVGTSMGAFVGSLVTTIEPAIGPTVINVGGGNYAKILKDSESFNPILQDAGIPEDTFDELQALHFIQWLGEHADPYTFAPYPVLDPLTELIWDGTEFTEGDVLPVKEVMIQMVEGDMTVPNSSTELLARTMGVPLDETTFPAGIPHGFVGILDPTETGYDAAECARGQTAAWMASGFAGDAEIPADLVASTCVMNQ